MSKDEFYIGYSDKGPGGIMAFVKKWALFIAIVVLAIGAAFALAQKQFKNGTFELGTLTEIEGVLYTNPYPVLSIAIDGARKDVLLLGFGKFGAEASLLEISDGQGLDGLRLKLQGTLIYYDGITLMQLEPKVEGTYEVLGREELSTPGTGLGKVKLNGEIIDPKCYFGVMKPGHGKIHRSCAVRCISGGIPPVFLVQNEEGIANYYLLVGENFEAANQDVLPHIGKPCTLEGSLTQRGDWMILEMSSDKIIELGTNSSVY